jgi:formate hydrogenlyase subunit 6/NADH:ubiquinone oxidoreductase subunit I
LRAEGRIVVGPTIAQEAIVYEEIESVSQLPEGWTDEQAAGSYRLKRRDDDAWFGYSVGPHSWKRFLFPATLKVASAKREGSDWTFETPPTPETRYAFLGVRACEIAAMRVQDRVFLDRAYVDPHYQALRENALVIATNCTQAASTCFCTSMQTGPRCQSGFDLALTEIAGGFVVETGSEAGATLLATVETSPATADELDAAEAARGAAVKQISKHLDAEGLRDRLLANLRHPRWQEVGDRCLSCTNCTMVCPTCFCHSVEDVRDLDQDSVDRERKWDSCFNPSFSNLSGEPVRFDTAARYRQWLTHKLATWHDQFDVSGCVGCGRCIAWCPVGIDIVVEAEAIAGPGE